MTFFTSLILFFTGLPKPDSQNARVPPLDCLLYTSNGSFHAVLVIFFCAAPVSIRLVRLLILGFPFLGIFLSIIIIVQTVIALGLWLVLNKFQVGKYATSAQQSQQQDQRSRVQSGRLLFFRLRCFCRRFRCFSRTFTLISYTDQMCIRDRCRAALHDVLPHAGRMV